MIGGGIFIHPIGAKGGWYATAIEMIGNAIYVIWARKRTRR